MSGNSPLSPRITDDAVLSAKPSNGMVAKMKEIVGATATALSVTLALAAGPKAEAADIPRIEEPIVLAAADIGSKTVSEKSDVAEPVDIDAAMKEISKVLSDPARNDFLSKWEEIRAKLEKNPRYFQEEFQSNYKTFKVVPRVGKYGSMVRSSIAQAEANGVPEEAPISMRDALGLPADKDLTEADVVKIFTQFYNPDTTTEEGKKSSTRYFAGFYKSAYAAGEFKKDNKFDRDAAASHRGGMVATGERWKKLLEENADLRKNLAKALNSAIAYFDKNGIKYSPEGYRKYVTHMASAIARSDQPAALEPGYEMSDIVFAVAPALKDTGILTLKRGENTIDIADTKKSEVANAWKEITGLPYTQGQFAKTANFVAYQFNAFNKIAEIAADSSEIASLKKSIQTDKKEIVQNKEIAALAKHSHDLLEEINTMMIRALSVNGEERKAIIATLNEKISLAQKNNQELLALAQKYNDAEAIKLAMVGRETLEEARRNIKS